MKNKTVKMILAVAVLLVCCGGYAGIKYYVARQEEAQEAEEEDETTSVVSLSADNVKSVEFLVDKKEVIFEKNDNTWVKQDENEFPVNQTTLDDAVSGVASLDSERVLENVEDLSEYGLSEPSNTIKVTTENTDGEEEVTVLRVGDENESESKYYVSKDDDRNTVYLVDSIAIEAFSNDLYDYAQEEDFPVISSTDTISKISVFGNDISSYELDKDEDTNFWYIGSGKEKEKADSASVSSLTTAFGSLAYDSFVDYDCKDKGEYGLDDPYAVISVDYQEEVCEDETSNPETDGEYDENVDVESSVETDTQEAEEENETVIDEMESDDTEDANISDEENDLEKAAADEGDSEETQTVLVDKNLTITIGDETSDGSRYVIVNDSNQVYTMSSDSLLTFLGKTDLDFWDMTVNYLYIDNLESLDVNYGGKEYAINVSRETSENEDGEEETTTEYSLNGTQIDKTDFTTFYNKLVNMAGQKRLTDQYEPNEEAEMSVTFVSTEDEKTEVKFFSYDTNYYAAVVSEKVYLVNKMNVKELFSAFEKLSGSKEEETMSETLEGTETIESELTENADTEISDVEEVTE